MSGLRVDLLPPEKIRFYLQLYGHVPWTVTVAEVLLNGGNWDTKEIADHLIRAQEKIDVLTQELKERQE